MISTKIIAGVFVLGIISALMLSGPAEAFLLSITIPDNSVIKGDTITINANIETEESERPSDINYLIIKLTGPQEISCKFLANATAVSGCDGIKIIKVPSEDSGYCKSYGYGTGCKLQYKITLESELYAAGTYETFLIINSNEKDSTKQGEDVIINNPINRVCSVRADDGSLKVGNMEFAKNKINFYMPLNKAIRGEGYLTGQRNRDRFMYKFSMGRILVDNDKMIKVKVSGKYRIGNSGQSLSENAILTFDRIQNVTSLVGDKINITNMRVSFRQWC